MIGFLKGNAFFENGTPLACGKEHMDAKWTYRFVMIAAGVLVAFLIVIAVWLAPSNDLSYSETRHILTPLRSFTTQVLDVSHLVETYFRGASLMSK